MKKILTFLLLSISLSLFSQEEALKRIAFPITDYILNPSDSIAIGQINMKNKTTVADVKTFLKYVAARPTKYAGKPWKISEIFATRVVTGAPTVIEN
jgi:hypothetical protein